MKYKSHDNVVIRREGYGPIEMWLKGKWVPFPEGSDGDIRQSAVAAWMEGSPLTEKEAKELMHEDGVGS